MKAIVIGRKYFLDLGSSAPVEIVPVEFREKTVLCNYYGSWAGRQEELSYELFEVNGYTKPTEPNGDIISKIVIENIPPDSKILENLKLWQECMKPQPLPKKAKKLTYKNKQRLLTAMRDHMYKIQEIVNKLLADEEGFSRNADELHSVRDYIHRANGIRQFVKYEKPVDNTLINEIYDNTNPND